MNKKNLLFIGASGGVGQKLIPYLDNYNVVGHFHKNKPSKPHHLYCADITNYREVEHMVDLIIKRFNSNTFTMDVGPLIDNGVVWYNL